MLNASMYLTNNFILKRRRRKKPYRVVNKDQIFKGGSKEGGWGGVDAKTGTFITPPLLLFLFINIFFPPCFKVTPKQILKKVAVDFNVFFSFNVFLRVRKEKENF